MRSGSIRQTSVDALSADQHRPTSYVDALASHDFNEVDDDDDVPAYFANKHGQLHVDVTRLPSPNRIVHAELRDYRRKILEQSEANSILETQIRKLDQKIGLLVSHRLSAQACSHCGCFVDQWVNICCRNRTTPSKKRKVHITSTEMTYVYNHLYNSQAWVHGNVFVWKPALPAAS